MLTTLDAVRDELGIQDASQDARLTRIARAASDAVESYCDRSFAYAQGTTELCSGAGRQKLYLRHYPVVAVQSVNILGYGLVDPSEYLVFGAERDQGYLWREKLWPWDPKLIGELVLYPDCNSPNLNVTVVYDHGYVTPEQEIATKGTGTPLTRNLPYDLELSVIRLCAFLARVGPGLRSEHTPGGYRYERWQPHQGGGGMIPEDIRAQLEQYRRMTIV